MSSFQIVTIDHYLETPHPDLDYAISTFSSNVMLKVPVIRVFGYSADGIGSAVHIHKVKHTFRISSFTFINSGLSLYLFGVY